MMTFPCTGMVQSSDLLKLIFSEFAVELENRRGSLIDTVDHAVCKGRKLGVQDPIPIAESASGGTGGHG